MKSSHYASHADVLATAILASQRNESLHYTAQDQDAHDSLISYLMSEMDECDYVEQRDAPTDLYGSTYDGDPIRIHISVAG